MFLMCFYLVVVSSGSVVMDAVLGFYGNTIDQNLQSVSISDVLSLNTRSNITKALFTDYYTKLNGSTDVGLYLFCS